MMCPELEMSVAKFVAVVAVAFVTALAVGFILLGVYLGSKEEKTMPKEMELIAGAGRVGEFSSPHDLKQHNLGKHVSESPLLTRLLIDMVRELPLSHSKNTLSSYLRILQEPEYAEEPTSRALRDSIERVLKALQQQEETDRKSRESWLFS